MQSIPVAEVARITGGDMQGAASDVEVTGIATDSRACRRGDLFVALRGESSDGHAFVEAALKAGAAAALVRLGWQPESGPAQAPLVFVEDPLAGLGALGKWARTQADIPVVGITGSMGKTTTREMLAAILRTRMNPLVSPANFNTEIGVPITLLDLTPQHDSAVIEMAMRGLGQISELSDIARPTAALVTNIGLTHMELLGSRANIARAKAELLQALPGQGWSVLPADDDFAEFLRDLAPGPVSSFGLSEGADFRAVNVRLDEAGCAQFEMEARGESIAVSLQVPGEFHVLNALAAAAAGARMGIPLDIAAEALAGYRGFDKRSRVARSRGGWRIFDDTYNASPAAMAGGLRSLAAMQTAGRRLAVIGDMRELGDASEESHRHIGEVVADTTPDILITVGKESEAVGLAAREVGYSGPWTHVANSQQAADCAAALVQKGDIVFVKGSRALNMERVVERLAG